MSVIKIKNKLRFYREKRALTQEELAEKAHVSRDTISKIENDKIQVPLPKSRRKLAQALEVEVHQLFRPIAFY